MGAVAAPVARVSAPAARVVELAGPAGAGKSTVLAALLAREPALRPRPRSRGWRAAALALAHLAALAPLAASLARRATPRVARETLRYLLRLRTYHALTVRELRRARGAIVLDEGPVFTLARLAAFPAGGPATRLDAYRTAWRERWARTLDLVVWLDAPDAVLVSRIRGRGKAHRVKRADDAAAAEFLRRYRAAYAGVLAELEAAGVRVLALDTQRETPEAAAERVLAAIRGGADAR